MTSSVYPSTLHQMDFSIVTRAGLKPIDLAILLGQYDPETRKGQRATASNWMRGDSTPAPYSKYYPKVVLLLEKLTAWVETGRLPKANLSAEDKKKLLAKIKSIIEQPS